MKKSAEREMAPQALALKHEAAAILRDWEQFGCPTATGRDWTTKEIQAAIDCGPHKSALKPDVIKHFAAEVADKVEKRGKHALSFGMRSKITTPSNSKSQQWQ